MKKENTQEEHLLVLGDIIDMPFEDFVEELKNQKVNIGIMNNMILNLESVFNHLRGSKDAIIDLYFKDGISENEVKNVTQGLYAEMIKIEQKIVYLKKRVRELINVDKH